MDATERCAKICDEVSKEFLDLALREDRMGCDSDRVGCNVARANAAQMCADKIRAKIQESAS